MIYCPIYRPILYLCFLGGNHPRIIDQKYDFHCWVYHILNRYLEYLYILLLLWTLTILPQEEANQIVHQRNHSTNMNEAGGWHKRGGGLRNNVGLGLKPVYYTDGGEALKAAGREFLPKRRRSTFD